MRRCVNGEQQDTGLADVLAGHGRHGIIAFGGLGTGSATALTIERISRLGTTTAYRLLRWCALTL